MVDGGLGIWSSSDECETEGTPVLRDETFAWTARLMVLVSRTVGVSIS